MTVQILFGCASLRTVHTAELFDIIVPLSVILQVRKFLKFLPANSTGALQSTFMVVVDNLEVGYQVLLGSTDCGTMDTGKLLLYLMGQLNVSLEIFHQREGSWAFTAVININIHSFDWFVNLYRFNVGNLA